MFKKYFSIFLLLISVLILVYTIYRSEFYFEGELRENYKIYYFFSFFLIFFSFATFFLSKEKKILISIFILSTLISFYTFEIYLSFSKKNTSLEKRLFFFKDEIKKDSKIKIIVAPQNFLNKKYDIIPLGGISNSKTIYCNENGYYSIYNSDRYGFNNPNEEHDSDSIEYFLVGDSFAHGACVNRPNDIASVLRKQTKKGVLNFGYGSHGPLEELAVLKEYLNKNVKNIIWIYYEGNDLINLQNSYKDITLKKYLTKKNFSQNLKHRQDEIDTMGNKIVRDYLNNKQSQIKIINIIKLTKLRSIFMNKIKRNETVNSNKENLEIFKDIIEAAVTLSKKNKSEFYFVYLPTFQRYNKKNYTNDYYSVINIINSLDINLIDIHDEIFIKKKNPLNLFAQKKYSHYSVQGYEEIAYFIFDATK